MNLKKIRDLNNFILALLFIWVYIPHITLYIISKNKKDINNDLGFNNYRLNIQLGKFFLFVYHLHNDSYFRAIFYHRIGIISQLFSWWRPGCKYFIISKTTKLGGGLRFIHPFSTIINAESIGKNFTVRHLCTIGNKGDRSRRPIIGNNVVLGVNVTIIGDIIIGDNVIVGAGSVITKNIPHDCTVVGNPGRIILRNGIPTNEKL